MHRRFINSIDDDSDDDDVEQSLHGIMVILWVNKASKSIKYRHKRLNWDKLIRKLQHTKQFPFHYHMTLPTFNKLVELLRPMVSINELKSRNSTANDEPIYPEMIVGAGLRFLGGSFYKDIEDIYRIPNHSVWRIVAMFVRALRAWKEIDICLPSTPEELEETGNGFAQCSSANGVFTISVGCIDGWLVCTSKPKESIGVRLNDYFSGHSSRFGFNIQAICDSQLRFTYFSVAVAGKTNGNRAMGCCMGLMKWRHCLPDGYFIIGDNAYTVSKSMIICNMRTNKHSIHCITA